MQAPRLNFYSIRDRLLNYHMRPFTAPSDEEAQAAVAFNINAEEIKDAVSQAPHHFEIWRLGILTEDAEILPNKVFVCDCASLVRRRVRETGTGHADGPEKPTPGGDTARQTD